MSKNTPLKTPIRLLVVALALGIMIAFHEFGHFCAARAVGIDVPVFSVGFGPREYSLVLGHVAGTELRLSPIPLGGYVEVPDLEQAVYHPDKGVQLALWKIWVVGLAGVVNNLLLSGLALYAALWVGWRRRDRKGKGGAKPIRQAHLVGAAFTTLAELTWASAREIWKLFLPYGKGEGVQLAGPISTMREGAQSVGKGNLVFCAWVAAVGIGLALINLLPVVPTDGGQIMVATVQRLFHLSDAGTAEVASWSTNLAIALVVATMLTRKARAGRAAAAE